VLAQIAGALGAHEVSIEQMVQEGGGRRASDRQGGVDDSRVIVLLTHDAVERDVRAALAKIDALPFVHGRSLALRVEG
jgi:homoserine dehydrogenase